MGRSDNTINLILDTDIGGDCDDMGALTLLHELSKKKDINFLAMTGSTSCKYIAGTIDAVNRYYGRRDIPVGAWNKPGFYEGETYSRFITENYKNSFVPPARAPAALGILKNALVAAEDSSVTVVSIGPLNNLAELVSDTEGYTLLKKKVKVLVAMAGALNPNFVNEVDHEMGECNLVADLRASITVFEKWPTPIVLSPFETGEPVITGCNFGNRPPNHPVRVAYQLFNKGDTVKGRCSWDLTAAWYAVMGEEPFFKLSELTNVSITERGGLVSLPSRTGRFRFLLNKRDPGEIARDMDAVLAGDS
jgi:inosine-uridine nucleoside N-ribohydrolase